MGRMHDVGEDADYEIITDEASRGMVTPPRRRKPRAGQCQH
jgi:hypothetical protein